MSKSKYALVEALISPMTIDDFCKEFWPDETFVIHGPLERLPRPFSHPEPFDRRHLFSKYLGRILFGKGTKGARSISIQQTNPNDLYDMGLSIYLPDIEPYLLGATEFLRELEKSLGLGEGEARITAWASPGSEGIACHFDAEEVFSVQLQGVKRFYVAEKKALVSPVGMQFAPHNPPYLDLYPQVPNGFPDPENFEFTEIVMNPGSVLFMPRGIWHRTEADQDSLSLSVALCPKSPIDRLLQELRNLLLQDPDWRRPLYGKPSNTKTQANKIIKKLPKIVKMLRGEDLLSRKENNPLENIQLDTRFQKIPGAHLLWEEIPERSAMYLKVNTKIPSKTYNTTTFTIEISNSYLPLLDWINNQKTPFSLQEMVSQFKEISKEDCQRIAAQLVQAEVLKLLWFRNIHSSTDL